MRLPATQYQTLGDLVSLEIPSDIAFADLCKQLISHYGKTINQRLEQTQFRSISRKVKA